MVVQQHCFLHGVCSANFPLTSEDNDLLHSYLYITFLNTLSDGCRGKLLVTVLTQQKAQQTMEWILITGE
jgi:hypothetical protein